MASTNGSVLSALVNIMPLITAAGEDNPAGEGGKMQAHQHYTSLHVSRKNVVNFIVVVPATALFLKTYRSWV